MSASEAALQGLDISVFVPAADWDAVKKAGGKTFAFIECARGTDRGEFFGQHWLDCGRSSLIRGAYSRFFSTASGKAQANAFIDAFRLSASTLENGDLPPVLDVEDDPFGKISVDAATYLAMMREWLGIVQTVFNRRPIIYTGPSFWNDYLGNPREFASFPLWIAQWNVTAPTVPAPWSTYAFWQYAGEQNVNGIAQPVDLDTFNGSIEALQRLITDSRTQPHP